MGQTFRCRALSLCAFSATDAMFAPVIFRFQTYRVVLNDLNAKEYMTAMLADPYMIELVNINLLLFACVDKIG